MRYKDRALKIWMLLIFSLILSGCANGKVQNVKHKTDSIWEIELEGGNPQFVEDYIYLWDLLENEYPMLATAKRITGKDTQEIKEGYYNRITSCILPEDFYTYVVNPCISEFGGVGHLGVINDWLYEYMCSLYINHPEILDKYPPSKYNYEVLTSPKAESFYYGVMGLEKRVNDSNSETPYNVKDNLTFQYFSEISAGYIKIKHMNTYSGENDLDYKALISFFEKLEVEGYENCIVDIRGNGGGNSEYWMKGLVEPNLKEPLEWESLMLIKGDTSRCYLSHSDEKIQKISKLSTDALPNLEEDDLADAQYFIKAQGIAEPVAGEKPTFSGRFWLLVDEGCYSSSEKLALFCKQTGFATIVGMQTGGDGIGVEPIVFTLPNTGICLRFSAANGLNCDGSCNEEFGTTPDYVLPKSEDALEGCIKIILGS
ncbi:MAG: hypothetical protein GX025_09495 [Clostridiales bacterium]|nr:hypothetical protein [Clostridiales bacterium]